MSSDIIVIADTQVKAESNLSHLEALARYIWEYKPAHIVHIGDHFDFPSLNPYQKTGALLVDDLHSGRVALDLIMDYSRERVVKAKGKANYFPELHFCMGNHEERLTRYLNENPELVGMIDLEGIIKSAGWNPYKYQQPLNIDGIIFRHFLVNEFSGRPIGGSIENKLNKSPYSFVHGHQQQFQFGRRQNIMGKPHFGVCAGAFYQEDEEYRKYENTEIRGFVHLKHFINRYNWDDFDVEFVSLERLLEDY